MQILPELARGGGPFAQRMVEGFYATVVKSPSTILRMVPLPQTSWGRISRLSRFLSKLNRLVKNASGQPLNHG